ncbi:MAG: HAD family hydrolase [Planctomycetota bacterium]
MLVLFDIDGTLLRSQRAGLRAMTTAGTALYGDRFTLKSVEVAGSLDPIIWRTAVERGGYDDSDASHAQFRAAYVDALRELLASDQAAMLLPGVMDLVERLHAMSDVTIALLTGNWPESGQMKVEAAGLDSSLFAFGAYGDDGATRRDLPPVALARYVQHHGTAIDAARTIIIGDTQHDVDCAQANGCRSLAVGTGHWSADELREHGADLTVDDLSDVDAILAWILESDAVHSGA